jgi:hypothetical protein
MPDPLSQPAKLFATLAALTLALTPSTARAQSDPKAVAAVRAAVASQMEADRTDRSNWIYTDHDITPEHDHTYLCIGSPEGELRRRTHEHGQPVSADTEKSETDRIAAYVNDPSAQAKNHKNQAHDDVQATALLKMLPDAFLWTITSDTPELLTLSYRPDPKFDAPDMESRVMSTMAGELVIVHNGNLIRTFRGTLTEEVKIGFGLIGHLNKSGTIDIERRDVGDGHWEITETHVHIGGHILFFKTIGTQQDEVKTNWHPSTARNLHEAEEQLRSAK